MRTSTSTKGPAWIHGFATVAQYLVTQYSFCITVYYI